MPFRDHFRQPTLGRLPWRSLHSGMLTELVRQLNAILPPDYLALDTMTVGGRLEVDVGTYEKDDSPAAETNGAGGGLVVAPFVWTPPAATGSFPVVFPDAIEVKVYNPDVAGTLVAAIEIVSPSNKNGRGKRRAFVAKCAGYLSAGAAVIILDAVTTFRATLHNELVRLLEAPADVRLSGRPLYAAAYRPVRRADESAIDVWTTPFAVGDVLPTMPLRLAGDLFVPVDFEAAYVDACRIRRFLV